MTDITLLDGSIGQEIVKRSGDRATPLWSTSVMIKKPGVVRAVHDDYFAAGATIATTNTYAVHRDRLERVGLAGKLTELLDTALTVAEAARDAFGTGRIAGALGPLGASYRPDICPPPDVAAQAYREIVEHMNERVDFFLIETASSVAQAEGALRGAAYGTKPVWLAISVDDDDGTRLRSGENLAYLAGLVTKYDPAAILINCSRPEVVAPGLEIIKTFGKPFGAFANGFTRISGEFLTDAPTVDALEQRQDMGPDAYADFAMAWVAQGASIIGGCCEIGPAHIKEIAKRLSVDGHQIV